MLIRIFILMTLVAGCAGRLTLEELYIEANQTGDWTKVDRRESAMAYDDAMESAHDQCKEEPFGRTLLVCVNLPRIKQVKYIGRHCGCSSQDELFY